MSPRSPLARAREPGSARKPAAKGTRLFLSQRVSAVVLIPLCCWFVFSMLRVGGGHYEAVHQWAARPSAALLLGVFVLSLLYHAQLGIQVVIEDYVHTRWLRRSSLALLRLLLFLLIGVALLSVLRIALSE